MASEEEESEDESEVGEEDDENMPAVPPPAVEKEEIPRPNIPGTNIPDNAVPESYPVRPGSRVIPDISAKMPDVRVPNSDIDPGMDIPHVIIPGDRQPYAPWNFPGAGKKI